VERWLYKGARRRTRHEEAFTTVALWEARTQPRRFKVKFVATDPKVVMLEVESQQCQYEIEAREPGNQFYVSLVRRNKAHWALCRQWAAFDEGLAQRDAEIERLRRIIDDMRYNLMRDGREDLVAKLDRKLKGR